MNDILLNKKKIAKFTGENKKLNKDRPMRVTRYIMTIKIFPDLVEETFTGIYLLIIPMFPAELCHRGINLVVLKKM
jgi:hypothetical protein